MNETKYQITSGMKSSLTMLYLLFDLSAISAAPKKIKLLIAIVQKCVYNVCREILNQIRKNYLSLILKMPCKT